MESVDASILNDIKSIFHAVSDGLKKLSEWGIKVAEGADDEGVEHYTLKTKSGNSFEVTISLEKSINKFTLDFTAKGKSEVVKHVPGDKIVEEIQNIAKKWFDEDLTGSVSQSQILQISLETVKATTDTEVYLKAVYANYDATLAMNDLNAVLDSEAFLHSLPTGVATFEITSTPDEYEVAEIREISECDAAQLIFNAIYDVYMLVKLLYWNNCSSNYAVDGCGLDTFADKLASLEYSLNPGLGAIAGVLSKPIAMPSMSIILDKSSDIKSLTKSAADNMIATTQLYMCNLPEHVQMVLHRTIADVLASKSVLD